MHPPTFKTNSRRRCAGRLGGVLGLVCGLFILAGCRTETKQKWLTFFFDGVPQPGATNAAVKVDRSQTSATNVVGQTTNTAPVAPPKPPMVIHAPYAQRDCTACHESQYSQKMLGKPGEVCFGCHVDLKKSFVASKVKHSPVAEGDCKSCHAPHQSVNKKLLVTKGNPLCLTCHDDPLAAGKVKHQAVAAGECVDCHAPHATNFKGLLKKSAKDTCAECHDDLIGKNKFVHQPVGDGDCLECHAPHAGKIKGLLKKPVKETCASCHDDLIAKKKFVHQPVADGDCVACHNPHAGKIKGLLKKPLKETCAECHDDIPNKKSKSIHQPVADGDCLACHNPHATDKKALVKKVAPALCWDCHDNFLEQAKFKHDVVEDCTSCHKPHQSMETGLLAKNILKLCADCHEDKDLKAVKAHAGTEGKSCVTCHDPHVGKDKFLLKSSSRQPGCPEGGGGGQMKMGGIHRWQLLASLLVVGLIQRLTPWARADDTQWFKLDGLPEPSVGLEMDSSSETTSANSGNSTYSHTYITPTVGLRTSGSIYHPNLLAFDLDGELGWGWDSTKTTSSGTTTTRNESQELTRYLAQMNLLQNKTYNASFFAAQDHTFRDYGTFDTFTVDSSRYGGIVNWNTEALSLNADFGYRDETASGLNSNSEIAETYFNLLGLNRRQNGQTTVNFRINQFDNTLNDASSVTSQNWSVGLSDSETFGSRKQITAASSVSYSESEYSSQQTETVNANENVTINHRPNLDSYLMLDFAHSHLNPATDERVTGVYGIRHQLYESLSSTLDAHGSHQKTSADGYSSTSDRYGLGLYENYTKRLQSWGRLSLGAGIVADHVDDNASGGMATTIDEPHQLYLSTSPQYRPVYLNRPQVQAGSILVSAGGVPLQLNTDYQIVTSGELTEVKLMTTPVSSHLQTLLQTSDNLAVAVTYASESFNNASYNTVIGTVQIRLDIYERFGVYGRLNWMGNDAPPDVMTQTLTDLVGGVDYNWRWLRAGAEYEDYYSNYSTYEAARLYQNLTFQIDNRSSLGLNFSETFYNYPDSGEQTLYQFLGRYSLQLSSALAAYVEGGYSWQDVLGTEQLQGAARTGLTWTRGKLSLRTGYEYNGLHTTYGSWTEEREKNRLFFYLKRTF